jgi:hypothetical protein
MNENLSIESDNAENSVKISLCFEGKSIELDDITSILQINPTQTKKREEYRIQNEFALDSWVFSLKEMNCTDIEHLFKKTIEIFGEKTKEINDICEKFNCEVNVTLVVHMEQYSVPYLNLSKETINFLSTIKTNLTFDIYSY